MLNWEIDAARLVPLVPRGTEVDLWRGRAYVSAVAFLFLGTRFRGLSVPLHRDFEELNLRFYVRRQTNDGWRRAVVFVKELVPRRAIAWIARALYNENYVAASMGHRVTNGAPDPPTGRSVSYWWRASGAEGRLELVANGAPEIPDEGTLEEFITEHYWGYAKQRDGGTREYRVAHPRWRVQGATEASLRCDPGTLYGAAFAEPLARPPSSAFLAEGSRVEVYRGSRLDFP